MGREWNTIQVQMKSSQDDLQSSELRRTLRLLMMVCHEFRDFTFLCIERSLHILAEPLERFRQLTNVEYLVLVYGHKGECRFATECSR